MKRKGTAAQAVPFLAGLSGRILWLGSSGVLHCQSLFHYRAAIITHRGMLVKVKFTFA
jgi:hypothetical protein